MLSSTSSSDERRPAVGRWGRSWLLALGLTALVTGGAEVYLRSKAYAPSMADSAALWVQQRVRVDQASSPPVVALGASRIQLGLDLAVLASRTGAPAIQLAIDGSSFVPVLQQLAEDENFTGTVLVSLSEPILEEPWREERTRDWLAAYTSMSRRLRFNPFPLWEVRMETFVNSHLALRTEGAPPYVILRNALTRPGLYKGYLTTRDTRERLGDYTLVRQPQFYAARVMRHFGEQQVISGSVNFEQFQQAYGEAIEALQPRDGARFLTVLKRIMTAVAAIEQRGGRVIFIRFPTDKLVWQIDQRRFPRERFWRPLAERHPRTIHFQDYPELARFSLPDGSHLDTRDRAAFTAALADVIEREYGWR